MSIHRHGDGLFWPSLFSISNEIEKKQLLTLIEETTIVNYTSLQLAQKMLEISNMHLDYRIDDPCVQLACEHVALKFMLQDSELAKDLLNEDDFYKANELISRKQYNSKLLQKLLHSFLKLLISKQNDNLKNLFTISIINEYSKVQEDEINHSYGVLKKIIEKTTSGVKNNCYYNAEHSLQAFYTPLNDILNQFILNKINYNFNQSNECKVNNETSTLFCGYEQKVNNKILQTALINDDKFWAEHKNFNIVTFLNEIVNLNDIRHAEKVLELIIENLQKIPHINLIFKHNFPLYMSKYDELVEKLEEQTFRFCFKRLEPYCDLSILKTIHFCYPMNKVEPNFFEIGQKVWNNFICKYNYPNNFDDVNNFLNNEINRFISGDTHEYNDIAVILDAAPFRYSADNDDRRLFTAYHPDCFSFDNIWKRVYLKAYAVTLLSKDEQTQFSYLQRIFVDLIKTIEKRIGICTTHQLDISTRTKHYEELKKTLNLFDINVNDEHKNDYIISLLDRDSALIEEADVFPILEQIGDAIYGFAVAELLFYDPNTRNMSEKFENLTRAEAQVLISKKHRFDKLYLQIGIPAKYTEYDSIFFDYENINEENLQILNQEKYLADSLEMIIGSIYRDVGIEQSINFTKQLLLTTFPEQLHKEVFPTEENKFNRDIDMDYWSKILPSPYSVMNSELITLWNALNKVILITSLGTETKEKRKYITNSFGNTAIYGEKSLNHIVTWAFHNYLNNGLYSVLQKYSEKIRNNYENNKNFN